jgi:anti-anti-sigma regulatory factor
MDSSKPKKTAKAKKASPQAVSNILNLPEKVDIASALDIANSLKAMGTATEIILNAKAVEKVTTPGVQVLLSAHLTAKENGGKITVIEPSEAFINNVSTFGFSNQLKEWTGQDG